MLASHRHAEILSLLKAEGRVSVADAAHRLRVAEETIRRDLKLMEAEGQVRRIHGGAISPRLDQEQPLPDREKVNMREKSKIGLLADRLVRDGMSIFLDTGTTTLATARRLSAHNLRVTTNSIDIALVLRDKNIAVNVTPGVLRSNDNALVGFETLDYARRRFFDIAFMGIGACNLDQGWMDYAEDESALRRVLLAQSRQAVLLADCSKFGRHAYVRTFALGEVRWVVSDRRPPVKLAEAFDEQGVQLVTE